MKLLIENPNLSISRSLSTLRVVGFWAPDDLTKHQRLLYNCYTVCSFMFLLGTYLIIQVVDLFLIWGDLALMTGTAFLLFTNMAQAAKIANLLLRRKRIQQAIRETRLVLTGADNEEAREIVKRFKLTYFCDRDTRVQQALYFLLTVITTSGWAASAEKKSLPLRAWYPYDTSKSPAYELTYVHQVGALFIAAYLNVAKDSLVSALIAQCRCRLKLLGLSLRTLCQDMEVGNKSRLSPSEERVISSRLRECVTQHQNALAAALELQHCFSEPTFAQFTVSLVIICVTAFQLVSQTSNVVRLVSMGTYLLNMTFQVFIYCYQGTQLSDESSELSVSAYSWPWYLCSVRVRRSLLILMLRTRRVAKITAAGFTTLTIASFMAIIKASYSLFTLLQQVEDKK